MNPRALLVAAVCVTVVAEVAGCAPTGLTFYDVLRTRTEQCSIRSNGEFCVEPEQFAPPVLEAWAVHLGEDADVLYVDEEAWVLERPAEGADPSTATRTATRQQVIAAGDNLCTTTETRVVEFVADGVSLSGTYRASTRLDGPTSCGTTPVGERVVESLAGQAGTP
jgi:hypothetical protein